LKTKIANKKERFQKKIALLQIKIVHFIRRKKTMKNKLCNNQNGLFGAMAGNTAVVAFVSENEVQFYSKCKDLADEKAVRSFWGVYDLACRMSMGRKVRIFCKSEQRYYEKLLKIFEEKIVVYQKCRQINSETQQGLSDYEAMVVTNGNGIYRRLCRPINLAKKNVSELSSTFSLCQHVHDNVEIICGSKVRVNVFGGKLLVDILSG